MGIPWNAEWLGTAPTAYPEPDADLKARGIRDKRRRYMDYLQSWLGITAGAFVWDIESALPDIPLYIIESWTQSAGWGAIIRHNGEYHFVSGINAAWNGKLNEWYMPRGIIVSAPYAPEISGEYIFGENAVLLRNDTYMRGLYPTICPKAELAVETDVSILCGLQNLRIINIIHTATDNMKTAAESFLRQIRWGRSGIITGSGKKSWSGGDDEKPVENLPTGGVPANYMQQLIETAQYIRGSLYNEIGLQSNYNMKREALNASEIEANSDTLRPLIDNMLECRRHFCDEIKRVFGVEISVDLSGAWKQRAEIGEISVGIMERDAEPDAEPEPETETKTESGVSEDDETSD